MFFSTNFVISKLVAGFRIFLEKVLNIRPRDKYDYYPIARWLVSKRLAFAVVLIVGILSLVYVISTWRSFFPGPENEGIQTYAYNNILLKFAKGTVRIRGKSGYLAYEGEVSDGACNGNGTLFNKAGNVVYQGNFALSKYEKNGTQFYDDGTLFYQGEFHENLHSGKGMLYRRNGSLEYEGEFALDKKEGEGILYDMGHNPIFTGQFSMDDIKYSDLIGKTAPQLSEAYTGKRKLYESATERTRFMPDIDAMTLEYYDEESVDEEATVSSVYVLRNTFQTSKGPVSTFDEIASFLGQPTYVGTSYATLPEVLAVNQLNEESDGIVLNGPVDIEMTSEFSEYMDVKSYDEQYEVYLRSYQKDGLVYTFVTDQGLDTFYFYYIILAELSDIAK